VVSASAFSAGGKACAATSSTFKSASERANSHALTILANSKADRKDGGPALCQWHRQLGMSVLITDHHLPGTSLPQAACIVNPNQRRCDFPSGNLAGVGVMFYVIMALRAELQE
jgi:DHH family putative phosphoesterase